MSSFDRRTFEDYHSVSNPIESEDNAAYSMIQLFEREYNKTIEAANKSYKVDEEKLKVYYDEEKDIRVDFYEERSKINREIEDEYVGMLLQPLVSFNSNVSLTLHFRHNRCA